MKHFCLHLLLYLSLPVWGQRPDTLRMATYRYAANDRIGNLNPFSVYLGRQTGIPCTVESYPAPKDLIAALNAGKVDIAFINTFGYLLLAAGGQSPMEPVAALNVRKGSADNYKTILLSSAASGIRDAHTLRAKAAASAMLLVSEGSTSGNLVPRMYLSSIGIKDPERQFRQMAYGKTHANTLQQVASGATDVAALGSNEYFRALAADSALLNRVNVLWISEEIALGPVLLKKSLPGKLRQQIKGALLDLHEREPQALESIKNGWSEAVHSERFIRVNDRYYDAFRRLAGNKNDLKALLERFLN